MFFLEVETSFEAAHRLPDYNGPCRHIHGHHWVVFATYRVTIVGPQGIAIDLVVLKTLLRQASVALYDHKSLNEEMTRVPTSENLALVIFNRLRKQDHGDKLYQVTVEETPGCKATYREEPETKVDVPLRGDGL